MPRKPGTAVVIDHGNTTRRASAELLERVGVDSTVAGNAVARHPRPAPPRVRLVLTSGSSSCSRCGTFKVSTRTAEEASRSGLLGLQEQPRARAHKQATSMGARREIWSCSMHLTLVYIALITPQLGFKALSPNPTRISSSLGFHPLKCVTLRAHMRIVMARVLLLCPITNSGL